jgi:ABC-type Na+ efflux pump permease subunit
MPTAVPITAKPVAPPSDLAVILRPFLLIAAVAFVMGFAGYVAFGLPHVAVARDRPQPSLTVSEPVADPSNPPIRT